MLNINESDGESTVISYGAIPGYDAIVASGATTYFDKVVDQENSDATWTIALFVRNSTGRTVDGYVIEIWDESFTNRLTNLVSNLVPIAPPGTTEISNSPVSAAFLFNSPLASGDDIQGSFDIDFSQTTGSFGMRQIALVETVPVPVPATLLLFGVGLIGLRQVRRSL